MKINTYLQIKVVELDEIDSLIGILVVLLVVVPIEENSSPILRNATDREGKKSLVTVSLSGSTHLPDIPVSLADLGGVGICVVHVYAKALDALLSQLLVRMYPQKVLLCSWEAYHTQPSIKSSQGSSPPFPRCYTEKYALKYLKSTFFQTARPTSVPTIYFLFICLFGVYNLGSIDNHDVITTFRITGVVGRFMLSHQNPRDLRGQTTQYLYITTRGKATNLSLGIYHMPDALSVAIQNPLYSGHD